MANKQLKEILDMAIQVKTDAYEFYSTAAKTAKDPSAKELLTGFAEIELKHRKKLENFDLNEVERRHHTVQEIHDFHLDQYLQDKEITPDSTVQDIMVHVMKRGQKVYEFYDSMLKAATSITVSNLFEELAAEELAHKVKVETEYDDFIYSED